MSLVVLAPVVVVALVVLLLPGLVATAPLRLGIVARVAASGVVGIALLGVAGVLFSALRIPFGAWQALVLGIVSAAAAFGVRRWLGRGAAAPPTSRRAWVWLAASGAFAALAIAGVTFAAIPEAYRVAQTYDNLFHMSAIAHILEIGDASSFTLRTLIETGRSTGFYPSGWHSLVTAVVQVTGVSVPVAANAAWLAVAAGVWVPGSAWLAQVCLHRFDATTVAVVAMPLAASFGAMPYALLSWGTLYPTFLATALLPGAIAVALLAGRAIRDSPGRRGRALFLGAVALGVAGVALAFAQPRTAATFLVLLLPVALGTLWVGARRAWKSGPQRRRQVLWALVGGAVAVAGVVTVAAVYAVRVLGIFDRPLEDRLSGPQARATQTVLDGLGQVLVQSWMTGIGTTTWPAVLLAAAVIVGVVIAVRTRGLRWLVISYAVVAVLFAFAAGSDDVLTKLATAVWYKDRYRLSSALPVVGVTLATLGIVASGAWAARRWNRSERVQRVVTVVLAAVVALTSVLSLALGPMGVAMADALRLPDRGATQEIVSRAQITFMQRLGEHVPEGQRVLGDPWDGSGWTQLFGDREPVFPHVNGQWDDARQVLMTRLPDIATDPAVCAALDALRVRFVLYNPHEFAGGDPIGDQFRGVHAAVEAGLFTPVTTDGDSTLYRIDQCGPFPE